MDFHKFASEFELPLVRIWRAGESCSTPKGQLLSGVYESSYCCFRVLEQDDSVQAVFGKLRRIFSELCESERDLLATEGIVKSLFCSVEEGVTIRIEDLRFLIDNEINLEIDRFVYD